ncbi:MAG: hypothetical protein KZQ60_18915 [Candidatus Thiodiazotropha sp. (ex Lucinoma aequizonata)]|nr:hypothetical protein [Candidatus Thiodiazotropha sp. (ex Lucinoma aequizonata)]
MSQDLVMSLSSNDTMYRTNTYYKKDNHDLIIGETVTEKGMAFNFDGTKSAMRHYGTYESYDIDVGYSLFMIFKARPPTRDPSGATGVYLFNKGNKLVFRWHGAFAGGKLSLDNTWGFHWFPNLFNLYNLESSPYVPPKWYILGISSRQDRTLASGAPVTRYTTVYINGFEAAWLPQGVEHFDRKSFLEFGGNDEAYPGYLDAKLLVCFEWFRTLSEEEQKSLAISPFQFLNQE